MKYTTIKIIMTLLVLCYIEVESIAQNHDSPLIGFEFLQFKEGHIHANHGVNFRLEIPKGFNRSNILNHSPVYHEHPFKVSTAAVYDPSVIIMVHAEALSDSSGYLDYSYMDTTKLSGTYFYTKENCVVISEQLFSQATDLAFFQDDGFDFYPAVYLKQYFKTSEDGNAEFVLSYGQRVNNCSENTLDNDFKERFLNDLNNHVILK